MVETALAEQTTDGDAKRRPLLLAAGAARATHGAAALLEASVLQSEGAALAAGRQGAARGACLAVPVRRLACWGLRVDAIVLACVAAWVCRMCFRCGSREEWSAAHFKDRACA